MSDDTIITIAGNLTGDPSLRYTPSGHPVANFTIASTPRFFDKQTSEWKDGETLFVRCSAWRETAENVSESLRTGLRVIAQGRLQARSFEDKEGNRRTSWDLQVDEIGPSLRKATAQVAKTTGNGQQSQPQGYGGSLAQPDPWAAQPAAQPQSQGWDTPATQPAAWDQPQGDQGPIPF